MCLSIKREKCTKCPTEEGSKDRVGVSDQSEEHDDSNGDGNGNGSGRFNIS